MQENVKALEILTEAHRSIADISIDADLEVGNCRYVLCWQQTNTQIPNFVSWIQDFSQSFSNGNASLNGSNRSQSMSILDTMPRDSKLLTSSNLSNSAHSLNTLNKDPVQAHQGPQQRKNSSAKVKLTHSPATRTLVFIRSISMICLVWSESGKQLQRVEWKWTGNWRRINWKRRTPSPSGWSYGHRQQPHWQFFQQRKGAECTA